MKSYQYLRCLTLVIILVTAAFTNKGIAQTIDKTESFFVPGVSGTTGLFTGTASFSSSESIELVPGLDIRPGANVSFTINKKTGLPDANTGTDMNWISVRMFNPLGTKTVETRKYYDHSGLLLQTQEMNIAAGNIMASQVIYDELKRPVINTLPAPLQTTQFSYKADFVKDAAGNNYSYTNFSKAKTNSPDPVANNVSGTLGWYYSNNNTSEPYVGTTGFPYSRQEFFGDGTADPKRASRPDEAFRTGSGHESIEMTMRTAGGELANYIAVRNKFFTVAELGELPTDLSNLAVKTVSRDTHGTEQVSIKDQNDHVLMTAVPGSDLQINNSFVINKLTYSVSLSYDQTFTWLSQPVNVRVYNFPNGQRTLIYQGLSSNIPAGLMISSIEADVPFVLLVKTNYIGGPVENIVESNSMPDPLAPPYHYFYLNKSTAVTISGSGWTLLNMSGNEEAISFSSGGTLSQGYYKLITLQGAPPITISYASGYSDVSYNFYNQMGQLVANIPPEGVKKLAGTGLNNFATRAAIPFINQNEYNLKGEIRAATTRETGRTEFVYRTDGNIRFSQDALQRASGRYSYVNYDQVGRVIETGEFLPGTGGIAFNVSGMSNVDNIAADGGLGAGTRSEWKKMTFNAAVSTGLTDYVQDESNLNSEVSFSENASGAKTWYNYDEEKKITWIVQDVPGLGKKTTDYVFNTEGKVITEIYQKNTAAETFVHYYEYDAGGRITAVYTNTVNNPATKKLQGKYTYYLHGPVKRLELGGNVQGLDYTYTVSGALKAINNSNRDMDPGKDGISGVNAGFAKDAFGMNLEYYANDYLRNSTNIGSIPISGSIAAEQYSGNIRAISWHSRKPASVLASSGPTIENPTMYTYSYDPRYQLLNATWGTPVFTAPSGFTSSTAGNEKILGYDAHGNISALQRTNTAGTLADNFTYTYNTNSNQLANVKNGATVFDTYTYDAIGRVFQESPTGGPVRYYKYDTDGRVIGIFGDAALTQAKVTFTYNERGQRITKKDWTTNVTTYYIHDIDGKVFAIYGQTGTATPAPIEMPVYAIENRLGLLRKGTGKYEYELNDHLGSTRVIIDQDKTIKRFGDYYPFGYTLREGGSNDYRYGYQGQHSEADPETKLNAFDLRMYDSRIGRWLNVDPKSEFAGPYISMGNNPVNKTDPDGGKTESTDVIKNKDGSYTVVGAYDDGNTGIYVVDDAIRRNRTGEIIGHTMQPTDFLMTNDANGQFAGFAAVNFKLDQLPDGDMMMYQYTKDFKLVIFAYPYSPVALAALAMLSRNKAPYDLKNEYVGKPNGIYTPVLYEGRIVPIRAFSNILFGKNMRAINSNAIDQTLIPASIFYRAAMPVVGHYNQSQNGGNGYNAGFPFYGEHTYSGSNIFYGFFGKRYYE